jgi:hypothetical protein
MLEFGHAHVNESICSIGEDYSLIEHLINVDLKVSCCIPEDHILSTYSPELRNMVVTGLIYCGSILVSFPDRKLQ